MPPASQTAITIDNQHVIKSLQRYRFLPKQPKENTEKNINLMIFLDSCHLYNADIPKLCYYYNLPILTTFSREACLGRIKYLPLLALSYSGIPVKELYYLFLWQITSKLNLILIVDDYVQYVCFKGEDVTSEVENEMQLEGNYCELLPRLESLLELSVIKKSQCHEDAGLCEYVQPRSRTSSD